MSLSRFGECDEVGIPRLLVNTTFYELHMEGNEEKYQMPVEALELEGLAQ